MKLLIAGGAGYVGSVLIPKLLDRGYKVDVVDLFWFGNNLPRDVAVLQKDIFQLSVEDLEPYDQVIFLAGLSNDPMAEFSPSKNFIFNAAAPAYLAYTAKNAKVKRYIYASSCSVYGYTENELFDETRPVSSTYPYGISKLQGEQAAMQLADEDFSVISLRKGTVWDSARGCDLTSLSTRCSSAPSRIARSQSTIPPYGGPSSALMMLRPRTFGPLKRTRGSRASLILRRATIRLEKLVTW